MRATDLDQVFELFRGTSVSVNDVEKSNPKPKRGFYEYPMSINDLRRKMSDTTFSLLLEDRGRIVSYLLAYPAGQIQSSGMLTPGHKDLVLEKLQAIDPRIVYADQLYVKPGLPTYVAGRVSDMFDYVAAGEQTPGIVTAIPQMPWMNQSSTRFALCRASQNRVDTAEQLLKREGFNNVVVRPFV